MMKMYQKIAATLTARINCIESNNKEWIDNHENTLSELEKLLPSGSGFDSGTKINLDKSTGEKIILETSYHHMDEYGSYIGWTDHIITVTPSLQFGFNLKVSGRDIRDTRDYIGETFQYVLDSEAK
jgi:hypothetical protein